MADKNVRIIIEAVDKATAELNKISGSVEKTHRSFKELGIMAAGMGVAVGGAISALGVVTLREAGKFEQYGVAFKTMLGDAKIASDLLADIKQEAKKTPFNLEELTEGSKKLLAYGVEADNLIPTLRTLGDITSGVGKEKMPQLILAFGQVKAMTRLTGMELRQFSEAGVPLLGTLATQFGVTTQEMSEMIGEGKVGFADVEKALQSMTAEGGKFHGLMIEQSKTLLGTWSNLQDSTQQLQVAIGNTLAPAINALVLALLPLIEKFTQFVIDHPQLTQAFFIVGAAILAVSTIALTLIGVFAGLTAVAGVLEVGIGVLLVWIGAIPIAIGIVIAAGVWLMTHWKEVVSFGTKAWSEFVWLLKELWNNLSAATKTTWENIKNTLSGILDAISGKIGSWASGIRGFIDGIRSAVEGLIGKFREMLTLKAGAGGGGGGSSFAHGGIVPGATSQPVPIIAHGGERVVPKTGADVNGGGGGSGLTINLNISGDVNSMQMVDEIVNAVKMALGREGELAQYGIGV